MFLREALDQGPLAAATLITADIHVDREITWAQVVDHPDIEPWVSEGHLLLSTGYNWPKDAEGAYAIVERLAAKGVCGVVLAVPHFIDHFPEASVKAALTVGLPLMEIPWAIPFSGVTQAIHRALSLKYLNKALFPLPGGPTRRMPWVISNSGPIWNNLSSAPSPLANRSWLTWIRSTSTANCSARFEYSCSRRAAMVTSSASGASNSTVGSLIISAMTTFVCGDPHVRN